MKTKLWSQMSDDIAKTSVAIGVERTSGSTQVGKEGNKSGWRYSGWTFVLIVLFSFVVGYNNNVVRCTMFHSRFGESFSSKLNQEDALVHWDVAGEWLNSVRWLVKGLYQGFLTYIKASFSNWLGTLWEHTCCDDRCWCSGSTCETYAVLVWQRQKQVGFKDGYSDGSHCWACDSVL